MSGSMRTFAKLTFASAAVPGQDAASHVTLTCIDAHRCEYTRGHNPGGDARLICDTGAAFALLVACICMLSGTLSVGGFLMSYMRATLYQMVPGRRSITFLPIFAET